MKKLLLALLVVLLGSRASAQSTLYSNSTTGNVGIGTTDPANPLDIYGEAVIGTSYAGVEIAPSNGLLVQGDVGIGTTNPGGQLDINDGANTDIILGQSLSYPAYNLLSLNGTLGPNLIGLAGGATGDGTLYLYGASGGGMQFNVNNGALAMTIAAGGNVGIGTAAPANPLDIYGEAVIGTSYAGIETAPSNGLLVQGNVGVGTTSPAGSLDVYGSIYNNEEPVSQNLIPANSDGFVNKFRNGNMLVSQRMATNTSTTLSTSADAYWIDGWYYHVTGASVSGYWENSAFTATTGSNPKYIPAYAEIKGATDNTAIGIYQRIEAADATSLAGEQVTVQFQFYNDSGASITPTVQTCYASALNNFATCTADLSATNMQACANNTTCTEAYSFVPSTSATNGYEIQFNFGAMTSSSDNIEFTGFDLRATPGVSTGTISTPPIIEQPTFAAELARDQRYYQKSYAQGTAPGATFTQGKGSVLWGIQLDTSPSYYPLGTTIKFPTIMRATPSITTYDAVGSSGKTTYWGNSEPTWQNGGTVTVTAFDSGFTLSIIAEAGNLEYTASSEL